MYARPRRLTSAACALVLLAAALLSMVALAVPAAAAERGIILRPGGPDPAVLQVEPGDTVTFFVEENRLDSFQLTSTSPAWPNQFDTRIGGLLEPRSFAVPGALSRPGTYTYNATREGVVVQGSVVIPEPPPASPAPTQPSSAAPQPPAPPPGSESPPPGGTGATALPPLTGGFGALMQPSPMPGGVAPPPTLALPLLPAPSASPLTAAGPAPRTAAAPRGPQAVAGDLAGQQTLRGLGLPSALAAVLAAGILSLLVRVLLAEPAARRVRSFRAASPVATVD